MRYRALHIHDLPADGAIAIIGENESGKTTIGEAVAFALFGETVKSRATDISQVVSWDAEEAHVSLEIEAAGKGYRIDRKVDKSGLHEATLHAEGDPSPVASDPDGVQRALHDLTGLTFDEFRHSLYLAQAELGLVRRGEGDGDVRRIVHEMVGIGAMDRAAKAARKELETLREQGADLGRKAGVARAVADAHRVPAGYGDELEKESATLAAEKAECERRTPDLTQRVARLRDGEAARERAAAVYQRLVRAIRQGRADRALAASRKDLGAVARGLESEQQKVKREVAHHEKSLGEVRSRVDRLIDYQAKIAELEARLDLYKLEVKRSLDAPEIDPADVEELESMALPATPAAGLKLSQARVERISKLRSKALGRAVVYFVLAILTGLVGASATYHLRPAVDQAAPVAIVEYLLKVVDVVQAQFGVNPQNVWLGLAIAGSGLGILFAFLCFQRIRRSMERADQVNLAKEAVLRLEKDVKDLQSERERLERLDLRKPLKFAEEAKELRNPTVHEQFQKIREAHNDFVQSADQRDALVQRSRAEEGKLRELTQGVENRLSRIQRIAKSIPQSIGATGGEEEAIPEKLEVVEARIKTLLDIVDEAEREKRDVERASADVTQTGRQDEPIALFKEIQEPLERTWRAVQDEKSRARFVTETKLAKLAANPGELDGPGLKLALQREEKLLDECLPPAERLRAEREKVEDEKRAVEGRHMTAVARLSGLGPRIEEVRAKRVRWEAAVAEAARLDLEVEALHQGSALAELTAELLEEATQDLRRRIGPMLAKYAAAVLPRLTGNRYRKVKVSPDLEIKVYSPEKNDFVPLVDLSIGAADQLLLALRLAVGQALVAARGLSGAKHFLFLDEPLASFDEHRAKAFLEILAEHKATFPQVFVVAHLHIQGLEEGFARIITPRIDDRELDTAAPPKEPREAGPLAGDGVGMDTTTMLEGAEPRRAAADDDEGVGMDTITMLDGVEPRRQDDLLDMDDVAVADEEGERAGA